jgi:hypothetical protein
MKRDMDLIRLLLLRVEDEGAIPDLDRYPEEQRIEHMALCIEAGLVEGTIRSDEQGRTDGTVANRLTWKGHKFLALARSEPIWKQALAKIKGAGGHATISVLEDLLKRLLEQSVGL